MIFFEAPHQKVLHTISWFSVNRNMTDLFGHLPFVGQCISLDYVRDLTSSLQKLISSAFITIKISRTHGNLVVDRACSCKEELHLQFIFSIVSVPICTGQNKLHQKGIVTTVLLVLEVPTRQSACWCGNGHNIVLTMPKGIGMHFSMRQLSLILVVLLISFDVLKTQKYITQHKGSVLWVHGSSQI